MNVYEEVSAYFKNFRGKKQVIGKSEGGRFLFAFFVGKEEGPIGIMQSSIHGREYITALLSLQIIERGINRGGAWVVPLSNPDGALLSEVGLSSAEEERRKFLLAINGGREDFSLWKANLNGVDLNVNFDARWARGAENVFFPAPQNYVGRAPFSERESLALKEFTLRVAPAYTLSLHTKGDVVYWRFFQSGERLLRDQKIAQKFSSLLNLPLGEAPSSVGGYKDWCIEALKIPAFTVEIGDDALSHPIKRERLSSFSLRYGDVLKSLSEAYFG